MKDGPLLDFGGKDIKNNLDECVRVIDDIVWEQKFEEMEDDIEKI